MSTALSPHQPKEAKGNEEEEEEEQGEKFEFEDSGEEGGTQNKSQDTVTEKETKSQTSPDRDTTVKKESANTCLDIGTTPSSTEPTVIVETCLQSSGAFRSSVRQTRIKRNVYETVLNMISMIWYDKRLPLLNIHSNSN